MDRRALMPELFARDELATFGSLEEFYAGIEHFLAHPEERAAFAARARARVLRDHTYEQRMAGRSAESIKLFQNFLQEYPQGRYAANAEYWIGEGLYAQGKYREALAQFEKVDAQWPRHHKNAAALLKMGMGGNKVGIGQLEVVDLSILEPVKAGLQAEIAKVKGEGRHSVFLLLTDIMKEGSEMLIVSDDPSVVEKAFGVKPAGKSVWLPGVMAEPLSTRSTARKASAALA